MVGVVELYDQLGARDSARQHLLDNVASSLMGLAKCGSLVWKFNSEVSSLDTVMRAKKEFWQADLLGG